MNPKNSLCMSRSAYIYIALLLLVYSAGYSQTFDRVVRDNLWNSGSNINGIRQDTVTVSNAEIYGNYESGQFRESWQAEKEWSAGVLARTLVHLSKFSMSGAFGFDNTESYGMCGSMLVNPGFYPVDIIEFTPGRKSLQKYSFDGGISYDLDEHWRIGGNIDFQSFNYSKRKDLRYTDYRLDMTVSPAVMWHGGDWAVGLNYIYSRNYETVKAEQIGTKVSAYYAFLDKGLMYGAYEVWGSDGVHLAESGIDAFPVKENIHGIAAQAQYRGIFAEAGYRYSTGSIGEKQSIWYAFPGHCVSATAGIRFGERYRQSVRAAFWWKKQYNDENVLEKVTSGGVTTTNIYASNRIYERIGCMVSPEYEIVADRWEFSAGAAASFDGHVSSQRYPYLYVRNAISYSVYADALVRAWKFDISAGVSWSDGDWKEEMRTVEEGVTASEPYRLEEYWKIQKDYETAQVVGAKLALRFNFLRGLYIEARGDVRHAFGLEYAAGADRWQAGLGFGYTF